MSYAISTIMRTALMAHQPLLDWCNTIFGKNPSVHIGNRPMNYLIDHSFPCVLLVDKSSKYGIDAGAYAIGLGLIMQDYEQAIEARDLFADHVVAALSASPLLMVATGDIHPDGQAHHPRHTAAIDAQVELLDVDPAATAPTGVYVGRAPDIGLGHEADYEQIV